MHVWLFGGSRVLVEGLAALVRGLGFEARTTPDHELPADVAVWVPGTLEDAMVPKAPDVPTLVVIDAGVDVLVALLARGYRGYLRADAEPHQLRTALEAVARGSIWAPREHLARAFSSYVAATHETPMPTPREIDVLSLLGRGLSNRAIARRLGIAERTVKAHVSSLLSKYHVKSRVELVVTLRDRSERTP